MRQIKVPSTICTTLDCQKAAECLRKTAIVPANTSSYPFTPTANTPDAFLCKGFLPIPQIK